MECLCCGTTLSVRHVQLFEFTLTKNSAAPLNYIENPCDCEGYLCSPCGLCEVHCKCAPDDRMIGHKTYTGEEIEKSFEDEEPPFSSHIPLEIRPALFESITDDMRFKDIAKRFGTLLNVRIEEGLCNPYIGRSYGWSIYQYVGINPFEDQMVTLLDRREWRGDHWAVSVSFGPDGRQIQRVLWRKAE